MTKTMKLLLAVMLCVAPVVLVAQGLDPASLLKPATDSWPQYSGDYSGRRYSTLSAVNKTTVKSLALAWVGRLTAGEGGGARLDAEAQRRQRSLEAKLPKAIRSPELRRA